MRHNECTGARRVHLRRRKEAVQLRRQLARCATSALALSSRNRCVRFAQVAAPRAALTVVCVPTAGVRGLAHQGRAHLRARRCVAPLVTCSAVERGEGCGTVPAGGGRDGPGPPT